MDVILAILISILFVLTFFWIVGESFVLCVRYDNDIPIIRSFFSNFFNLTILGKLLRICFFIISIPSIILSVAIILIITMIVFLYDNLPKLMYKDKKNL